ncbi:MAG: hypothetical protein DHS80DRAFT_26376 [Piptocephalis tieghemiana]|nr:MAG: hypothetical protein DHS80DRAFT_26376 [Piptocephalis tieghemiana]
MIPSSSCDTSSNRANARRLSVQSSSESSSDNEGDSWDPMDEKLRSCTRFTTFLIAAYPRYKCPYVWLLSPKQKGSGIGLRKDPLQRGSDSFSAPLSLTSTELWTKEGEYLPERPVVGKLQRNGEDIQSFPSFFSLSPPPPHEVDIKAWEIVEEILEKTLGLSSLTPTPSTFPAPSSFSSSSSSDPSGAGSTSSSSCSSSSFSSAPRFNPFSINHSWISSLPGEEAIVLTGALTEFLTKVTLENPIYLPAIQEDIRLLQKQHFSIFHQFMDDQSSSSSSEGGSMKKPTSGASSTSTITPTPSNTPSRLADPSIPTSTLDSPTR